MPSRQLAALRRSYRFLRYEILFGTLLYRYGVARHRELVKSTTRSQSHTYTRFYRSPGQLEALAGPVLDTLLEGRPAGPLRIHVFASSNGAESYTLASVLCSRRPEVAFEITASDLQQDMVERGRVAEYSSDEVHYWATTNDFVDQTFDKVGETYVVKPHIRSHVSFRQANLLDPNIVREFDHADLVFMQNVLCHLEPGPATKAFFNVVQLLKPRSALFVDGMSLDLRESLTRAAGLMPVAYALREIHEFARTHVGERWWNYYYGMEPYAWWHLDRDRRFSTIFLRDQRCISTQRDVIQSLGSFVSSEIGGQDVAPNDPLLSNGLLDSLAIVKLLNFMEHRFGIEISDSDFEPENFQSLNSLAALVARHS